MFHLATKYCCILMILKWREILQVLYKSPTYYYFVPLHFTSCISAVCASLHHSNRIIRMNLTFCHILTSFTFLERGCPAAALRVWPWRTGQEKTPIELCGDTLDTYKQILSETNILQLSFYLADKAVGAKGFKATWTEIKVTTDIGIACIICMYRPKRTFK